MSHDIVEEPLTPESIQEIITRQDEDLQNLEGRVFDPDEVKPPVHKIRYRSLQLQIRDIEKDLFRKKRQLADLRRPTGSPILYIANFHNCSTCYNEGCIHWLGKKNPNPIATVIQNITKDVGCLTWLPPREVP
jgi:hypothetical protein